MEAVSPAGAPGDLELVRRFVNTLDVEAGTDVLAEPAGIAGWFAGHGLLPGEATVPAHRPPDVLRLREALRVAMLANHDRTGVPPDALTVINAAATRAGLSVEFGADGARPRPLRDGIDGALGTLLAVVAGAMAAGTWPRLKVCLNDRCRWAFYDHSNARSSKWCDMRICGNRAKQQAWRARSGRRSG